MGFFTSFRMTENKKKYVILSVSEISHDQSEKYMPVRSSVGFFTSNIRRTMLPH